MAGRNLRFGFMAGACCAALGLLVPAASAQAGADAGTPFELAFWQAISASNDPVLYQAYLKQYPAGTFAAIAAIKVERARDQSPVAAAVSIVAPPGVSASAHKGGLALPVPAFGSGLMAAIPGAAIALRDVAAAKLTAEAAQAAAAAAPAITAAAAAILPDRPVVTALVAPPAPTAAPTFAFAPGPADPVPGLGAQDMFGNPAEMPVGSSALLASLAPDTAPVFSAPAQSGAQVVPPVSAAPVFAALAPPMAALAAPEVSAPAATAAMLAALGVAPTVLPGTDALQAAVAAQSTPARLARVEAAPIPAPVMQAPARPQYANASFVPRPRNRRDARSAQFMRAVVSSAAVSVEMPDATSQISPLGIMLGQMVRTQETPGTQFGLQEDVAMPMRPRLMAVPDVALPESFCSIEQRSAFSEGIYQPALAIAQHNAQAAGAYVRKLRALYDNYQLTGDSTALTSVAAEARDFSRAANAANSIHDALVNQFEDIMTTPVGTCGAIQ